MATSDLTDAEAAPHVEYDPEFCEVARAIYKLGGTDLDVAEAVGSDVKTIEKWRRTHEAFCKACQLGREMANESVQRSLFRRCIGYDHKAEKLLLYREHGVVAICREHVQPDLSACKSWLLNRRPERWKKKPGEHDTVTPDEARARFARAVMEFVAKSSK